MTQFSIQQAFQTAVAHHQAGRLPMAEQLYRQILQQQPNNPDATHLLGVIAAQVGRYDAAADIIRRALALKPSFPEALNNLANALKELGQYDDAIAACRQAIAIRPNFADAYNTMGNSLREKKLLDDAAAAYQQAIALRPDFAEAMGNLGTVLREQGHVEEAIEVCQRAVTFNPRSAPAYNNLGNALLDTRQIPEAIEAYQRAIALAPQMAEAHNNLGNALRETGRPDEAIAAFRQAIAINPRYVQAYSNLGTALRDHRMLDEAIAAFRHALSITPDDGPTLNNLAGVLKDTGQIEQAIAAYEQVLERIAPGPLRRDVHSNICYSLYFHPGYDNAAISQECRRWNEQYAEPLSGEWRPHENDRNPDRRLKIGYVSPDFRLHAAGFFLTPLLESHDHQQFEIHCFSSVKRADDVTDRLRLAADAWHDVRGVSDEQLVELIRQEQIDVLVDLTMHMADSRLLTFARKPAPVQVTWLAYPGTTGLTAIDYRISDPHLDPPGLFDKDYAEETIRLPHSFWCYDPLATTPVPNNLPALQNGYITFGSLNNPAKINPVTLSLWKRVLHALPTSRLIVYAHPGAHRQQMLDALAIDPARVEIVPRQAREQYLETFQRIDLCLETLPANGHTTSLDSYWMGVPVVTLVGKTAIGRAGLCQLLNLGLPELIAETPEQYEQITVALANDLPRLTQLRATLRNRLQASPLMDSKSFTAAMESAFRSMWQRYCQAGR